MNTDIIHPMHSDELPGNEYKIVRSIAACMHGCKGGGALYELKKLINNSGAKHKEKS